jgi:hypothetical protein
VKILSRNNLAVLVICGLIFSLQGCGSDRAGITPEEAKELDGLSSRNVTVDDRDGDGISNDDETNGWTNACGESFTTDPDNWDSDGDYLKDGSERDYKSNGKCTNPANPDSDGDGLKDGDELRSEVNRTQVTNPIDSDSDDDGLNDYQEVEVKDTNATNQDSDGDMLSDGVEVNSASTNPKLFDSDSDGVSDGIEVCGTTNGSGYGSGKVITVSNSSVNINITDGSDFYTDKLETLVNHYGGGSDCSTPANSNSSDSPDKIDALDPTNDSDGDGRPNASEKAKSKDPLDYNSTYPWITETVDGVKMIAAGFEYIPKGSSDGKGFWMGKYEASFVAASGESKVDFNTSSNNIVTNKTKIEATTLIDNSQVSGLTRGDYNISLPLYSQYEDLFRVGNGFDGADKCLKIKNLFYDPNVPSLYSTKICELKSNDELIKNSDDKHYIDGDVGKFGLDSGTTAFRATTGYISE